MKIVIKRIISILICLSLIIGLLYLPGSQAVAADSNEGISVLVKSYNNKKIASVNGVEAYSDHWFHDTKISGKISLALANSLTISNKTTFTNKPTGYDPGKLIEWGKYPGLNMDILQKYGFTGKGAVVAYVDQPVEVNNQEQYKNANVKYVNNSGAKSSMHGPAVLSLLCGKDTGTAPDATVYYYAHAAWKADQKTHAECLYQIIEKNKTLSKGKKITMVAFSDNIDSSEKNEAAFKKAVKACEDAGIMVWFCGEYGSASFLVNSDKNNFENLTTDNWIGDGASNPELVYVPAGSRTTAYDEGNKSYIYWSSGGLSWTMPFMVGLYGIIKEIDPSLSQSDIRELVLSTAYTNSSGMRIVNPVELVAATLDRVGKKDTAKKMRAEVKKRNKYTYAIMNTATLNSDDLTAITSYLGTITDSTVITVDAAKYKSAADIYDAVKADHKSRGGKIAGIQIFGTSNDVPAFEISYKSELKGGKVDEMGTYLTDYFFTNLKNDSSLLNTKYSVYDHFKKKMDVDLNPSWPVARLPLSKGQYKGFFSRYSGFEKTTALKKRTIVNFSNPIFAQKEHIDDMGYFLNRMTGEFKLKITTRLYGNLDGQYPVTTRVLGNFTAANLKKENANGIYEFLINSHGQQNNIDQATFENGKEKRKSLINSDNINSTFSSKAYYLDTWTCNNGYNMNNNLITTALNGKCVGAFAATTIISNNGVDNKASVSNMKKSNFYCFYYNYLKALSGGSSRSTAFYKAQKAYAEALLTQSKKKIDYGASYQFNLNNLLCYHNFGVLSANPTVLGMYKVSSEVTVSDSSLAEGNGGSDGNSYSSTKLTDGKAVSTEKELNTDYKSTKGFISDVSATMQELDNGYMRVKVKFTLSKAVEGLLVFNPPNGDLFMMRYGKQKAGKKTKTFDIPKELLDGGEITINCYQGDTNNWIFIHY